MQYADAHHPRIVIAIGLPDLSHATLVKVATHGLKQNLGVQELLHQNSAHAGAVEKRHDYDGIQLLEQVVCQDRTFRPCI